MEKTLDMMARSLYVFAMKRSTERLSKSDKARARAELLDWLPAVIVMVLLSLISEGGLFGADGSGKLFWSLLNIVPALWIIRAVIRSLRRADEYQRRGQLEALAIGFGVMMLSIHITGLLQIAEVGDLAQQVQISFIVSLLSWVGTLLFKAQRAK
jgi:hypothetical protein